MLTAFSFFILNHTRVFHLLQLVTHPSTCCSHSLNPQPPLAQAQLRRPVLTSAPQKCERPVNIHNRVRQRQQPQYRDWPYPGTLSQSLSDLLCLHLPLPRHYFNGRLFRSAGRSLPLRQQAIQQLIPCLLIMKKQNIIIAIMMRGNIHQKPKPYPNHAHGNI